MIAFSTFNAPVPDPSAFGRPSSTLSGLPAVGEVLCTNPAGLGGGSGQLRTVYPSAPFAPGTTIGGATEAGRDPAAGGDHPLDPVRRLHRAVLVGR